jgi:hypothetical protein
MRPSGSRQSIALYPEVMNHHLGPSPRFLCQAKFPRPTGDSWDDWCLLSTDTVLAVLPPQVERRLQVAVQPLGGWAGRAVPDWCGVPCRIGYVAVDFPVQPGPAPVRLLVWVRVPSHHEAWMPDYLILGTQFLDRIKAEVHLRLTAVNYARRLTQPCGEILF